MNIGKVTATIAKATGILCGVLLLAFILLLLNQMFHPFAITDPDDPGFDPKEFRFDHYSQTTGDFRKAIEHVFPPGTDRTFVEEILVKKNYADGRKNQNRRIPETHSSYSYQWPPKGLGGWVVHFIFDENDKSIMMSIGGKPIYGTNPTYEWVQERKRKRRERMGHGQ